MEYLEIAAVKEHGAAPGCRWKLSCSSALFCGEECLAACRKAPIKDCVAVALGSLTCGQFHRRAKQRSVGWVRCTPCRVQRFNCSTATVSPLHYKHLPSTIEVHLQTVACLLLLNSPARLLYSSLVSFCTEGRHWQVVSGHYPYPPPCPYSPYMDTTLQKMSICCSYDVITTHSHI